jgi:hypothetical protein
VVIVMMMMMVVVVQVVVVVWAACIHVVPHVKVWSFPGVAERAPGGFLYGWALSIF